MNQQIFSKFNQYDLFGYFMVGSIGIIILLFDLNYFCKFPLPVFDLNTAILWFILVYFFGNLIQGLTNILSELPILKQIVAENKENFNDEDIEILGMAKKYFKVKYKKNSSVWYLCYQFVLPRDSTGQIEAFNSYYSLCRGWFVIFIIESIFLTYIAYHSPSSINIMLLFLSVLGAIIFYFRKKRFWSYSRDKVLKTFIALTNKSGGEK